MRVSALVLFAAASFPSAAQQSAPGLDAKQLEGLRHFNQACRVCHTKPQMTSPQYAAVLNGATLGGSEGAMRAYIANGTERMPGFRYHFKPAEIDALVSYLKSVPPGID
ncbi:MAG: Cytochrome oxidase, cbb3-type, subunit [Betaproteobacteria bacterium]|nr:Cytochrome oxidase, cbb3-type, subunit [Betaproteobacteria bacterium]